MYIYTRECVFVCVWETVLLERCMRIMSVTHHKTWCNIFEYLWTYFTFFNICAVIWRNLALF